MDISGCGWIWMDISGYGWICIYIIYYMIIQKVINCTIDMTHFFQIITLQFIKRRITLLTDSLLCTSKQLANGCLFSKDVYPPNNRVKIIKSRQWLIWYRKQPARAVGSVLVCLYTLYSEANSYDIDVYIYNAIINPHRCCLHHT
jgi:hypothetical protein